MLTRLLLKLQALPRARRKLVRSYLLIALALLLLGSGNLLYGHYKYHEYRKLWREATVQVDLPGLPAHILKIAPTPDIGYETLEIAKLKSRLDFYDIVMLGGQCFCVLALIFGTLGVATIYQPLKP